MLRHGPVPQIELYLYIVNDMAMTTKALRKSEHTSIATLRILSEDELK